MEHAVPARSIRWLYAATEADWDALFGEQLPRVYNFFRYRVGIRADAEDLTSITFERAWRARHQGRSPEVSPPAGVDLPKLGEIGLRILGLERAEVHRLAQAIDWRSTLIVPVPAETTAFRQVEVQGNRGLLMRMVSKSQGHEVASNTLVWSDGGHVYAMNGRVWSATRSSGG